VRSDLRAARTRVPQASEFASLARRAVGCFEPELGDDVARAVHLGVPVLEYSAGEDNSLRRVQQEERIGRGPEQRDGEKPERDWEAHPSH
jgi:hypothetical protein